MLGSAYVPIVLSSITYRPRLWILSIADLHASMFPKCLSRRLKSMGCRHVNYGQKWDGGEMYRVAVRSPRQIHERGAGDVYALYTMKME